MSTNLELVVCAICLSAAVSMVVWLTTKVAAPWSKSKR